MIPLMLLMKAASKAIGGKDKGGGQKPAIMFDSFGAEDATAKAKESQAAAQEAEATRQRRLAALRGSMG